MYSSSQKLYIVFKQIGQASDYQLPLSLCFLGVQIIYFGLLNRLSWEDRSKDLRLSKLLIACAVVWYCVCGFGTTLGHTYCRNSCSVVKYWDI